MYYIRKTFLYKSEIKFNDSIISSLNASIESLRQSISNQQEEFDEKIISERKKINEQIKSDYAKKLSESIEKKTVEYNERVEEIRKEYEEAVSEQIDELKKQIDIVDETLGQRIQQIKQTNTLYFNCVCNHKPIPCEIDFSKEENYFECPECGSIYRVQIDAYPVLISNISGNTRISDIIESANPQPLDDNNG